MLPLGLGRNSAGLLRALRTPIPRSPGLPDAAGSGVLSGWRNLRRKPCRIRLCRRFSRRVSGMPSCAFFRRAAPGEARILRCAAKSARCGARFCGRCRTRSRAEAWPARRSPSEHCRRPGLRVLLAVRGFLRTGGRSPASAGKRLSRRCSGGLERRRSAAERSPDFPAFPAGWRKRMRRGKR